MSYMFQVMLKQCLCYCSPKRTDKLTEYIGDNTIIKQMLCILIKQLVWKKTLSG